MHDFQADGERIRMRLIAFDEDYLDLFDIPLVAGRGFDPTSLDAAEGEVLLNEAAVKTLGWDDPVGKAFNCRSWIVRDARVVGVVKDFHTERLSRRIEPVAFLYHSNQFAFLGAKVRPDMIPEALEHLEAVWRQFLPEWPFEYWFLDDRFDALYQREEQTAQIMRDFSALAILLGCMGLFGLVSFTVQQRRKEIGIRKALGASTRSIAARLLYETTAVVVLANAIAWPVGLYLLWEWLNRFAYRIDLHVGFFAYAGGMALLVALMTVGYQAARAAHTNPVDVLRTE